MPVSNYLEHPLIQIAAGRTLKTSSVHKFGAVPSMSVNTTGTIWDVDDTIYPWSTFATAGTLSIPAVNAADNGHTVTIVGLDENWEDTSEEVTVSSSGATTTTTSFKRVFRAFCTAGGATNTGNINIQKDGTTIARITAGKGQTLMALYTVPAGKTAYMLKGAASIQYGGDATIDMFVRYTDQDTFRIGHSAEIAGTGMPYIYEFGVPVKITEKSDIDIRAKVRSNNARITAAFDIILVDN